MIVAASATGAAVNPSTNRSSWISSRQCSTVDTVKVRPVLPPGVPTGSVWSPMETSRTSGPLTGTL